MFTDIVGFSRQMDMNETHTLRLLEVHDQLIQQAVAEHHGTVIKTVGDAFLVDFPSVVHAVQCAQQIQAQFHTHNVEKEPPDQIHVRIGIQVGDIVQRAGDVFGDGVNVASRLQGLAKPDTICISHKVYEEVAKKLPLGTVVSLGRPKLKNIAQREPVYALLAERPTGFRQHLQVQRLKFTPWRRTVQAVVAVLFLVGAAITGWYFSAPTPPGLPFPDKPSIVVLPFTNMSGDPEQEYFSDGITEDITTGLAKIASLFVISRNSAFTYKGKAVKLPEVSRELGVQYVVEGSVRKAGDQVRITAQLIDATQDQHMWSERYDRPLKDIFVLQDDIQRKIVTALKVKLAPEEQERFRRAPTENLEAYDDYLRGTEYYWRLTPEAHAQARVMFEKALALDPRYAAAYALLGMLSTVRWVLLWSQDPQTLEQGLTLGQQALALNESLPVAHRVLCWVYTWKKQHELAVAEGLKAIALDPNDADSYAILSQALNVAGKPEEALGFAEKAMRLNPHYPAPYAYSLGWAYSLMGRYEEAMVAVKRAIALNPNWLPARLNLAAIYSSLGREEEARAEVAEVLRIAPSFSLEIFRQRSPNKDPAVTERTIAALSKAGLK
jgi:adenylate cyclase